MRYSELIEQQPKHSAATAVASSRQTKKQLIRIPAGAGPVQVYVRDGKLFVISDQPLERVTQP